MIWKKFTIDTTQEAVDFISQALSECGVEGIEIEDNAPLGDKETQEMFVDIMPELPEDDGSAKVHFYLDGDLTENALAKYLSNITEALRTVGTYTDAGSLEITAGETDDKDWLNNWKQFFHPFRVDDIMIKPTWETAPKDDDYRLLISIDPGAAFGTGSHETTKLCIKAIRKYISRGDRFLDIGTGSGILSIVALKSGASFALGTDLDPCAITAARENADVNGIKKEAFEIVSGNIIDDEKIKARVGEGYDMCAANILAPAIIMLQKEITKHIKDGAIFIVSGIIESKETEVRKAFGDNPEWEYLECSKDGEWVSLVYRKRRN